jgi:hypothetical protein
MWRLVGLLGVVALAEGQGCAIGSGALCQTCASGGTGCASCNDGFLLSGAACEPCPEACSQCSNSVCPDLVDTECYRYGNWILTVGWEASVNAPLVATGAFSVTSPEFFSNRNLTFNSATGEFSGTPTAPGTSFVRVTNSDGFACAIVVRICPSGFLGPVCSCPVSGDPLLTLQPFNPNIANSSPGVTSSSLMGLDIILEPNAMNPAFSLTACSNDAVLPWTGAYNENCQMVYSVQIQYPKCNLSVITTQAGTMASVSGSVTVASTIPLVQFDGMQEYRRVQSLVSWYFSLPIQLELSQTHFYTNSTRICDTTNDCNAFYCDTSSHTCQCNTAISGWDGANCLSDVKAPSWTCNDVFVSFTQDPSTPFALQSQTTTGSYPTATDNNPLPLSITGSLSGSSTPVNATNLLSEDFPWWPFLGGAGQWTRQVAYTATDAQQNSANCVVTVHFTDVAAPSISCPNSLVTNSAPLAHNRAAAVSYSDNTPGCALSAVPDPSSITSDGKYSVVYTATDTSGNTNGCSSDIVFDTVAPVITCVTSLSVNTNSNSASYSLVLSDIAASTPPADASAAPLVDSIINSAQWAPGVQLALNLEGSRAFTSTFAQSDAAGNVGTCLSTITVTDDQVPTATCTASLTQDVGEDSNAVVFVPATFADNVGVSNVVISAVVPVSGPNGLANPLSSYSDLHYNASGGARAGGFVTLGIGAWSVAVTGQDYNSNSNACTAQVVVTDTQAPDPSAICAAIPSSMTLGSTSTLPFAAPQILPSDNQPASAPLTVSYTLTHTGPDTPFAAPLINLGAIPWGSNQIQVQSTDASGNTAACSQTVQVEDHTAPTIHVSGYATTLQFNTAVSANTVELAYSLTTITQLAGDAKTVALISWDNVQLDQVTGSATTFPIGTTTLDLTVTDCAACSGLVGTYSVSIEVVDPVLPVVHCPSDVTINAGSNQPFASIGWGTNATDNDQVTKLVVAEDYLSPVTINAASFTQSPINYRIGRHTFVVTAFDASLNTQTCTFVLNVLPACGDGLVTGTEECDGGEGCNACVCDSAHSYLPAVDHSLDKDAVASFATFSQFGQSISATSSSEFSIVIGVTTTPPTGLGIYVSNVDVFDLGFTLQANSLLIVQVTAGCGVTVFVNGDQLAVTRVLSACSSLRLQNDLVIMADAELASLRVFRRALTLNEINTLANAVVQQPLASACGRRNDVNTPCAHVGDVTLCANFSAVVAATEPIQTPDCPVVADEGFFVDFNHSGYGLVTLCDLPERPSLFLVDFSLPSPSFSTLFGCPGGIAQRTYDVPTDCWQFPVCTPGYYTTGVVAAECPSYIACDSDTVYGAVTDGNDAGVVFDYVQSTLVAPLPTIAGATLLGFDSVPAGITPVNSSYASHSVFHVGTYSVVFQAGNATKIDQCTVNIVILDKTPPVLTCQDSSVSADAGMSTRVLSPSLAACSDDVSTCVSKEFCAGIGCTQWLSELSVFTFPLGNTSVQWRAVDAAGNEGSCTQVVSIRDMEAPTVTENYPTTVAAPATSACADVSLQINDVADYSYTVTDNVDSLTSLTCVWRVDDIPTTGTVCLPIQPLHDTYSVNLSCTDQSGNTGSDAFDLQVTDVTPPSCVSLAPVVVTSSDASFSALNIQTQVYSAVVTAGWSDNNPSAVSVNVPLPSNAAVPSSQAYAYSVSDGYSVVQCQITVTVEDVGVPVIQCTNETIAPTDDSYLPATPPVLDNSGASLVAEFSKAGTSHYVLGDNEIVWTATDGSGNVGTCVSTVTVVDSTPPSITCPSDVVILSSSRVGSCVAGDLSSGCCLARSTANPLSFPWSAPIVTDNYQWQAATVSTLQADLCVLRNDTQITYTATDAAGLSASCHFRVTLIDDTPPTFSSCPSNVVQLTLPATTTNGSLTYDWSFSVADDLQNNPSLGQVKIDGLVQTSGLSGSRALMYGDHTFEFQISDATQISVCSYHVFVSDVTAPVLTCPPDQIIRSVSSDNHGNFDPTENHAFDSEPDYTGTGTGLVMSDNSFTLAVPTYSTSFPYLGAGQSTTATISVADAANNLQTCQYQVTVLPKLASATVDGALSKVTLNRRQDGSLYASMEFLTSVPWPWLLAVATQTDSNLEQVQISAPDDCPATEFSTPHDSCRQTFSALADLPSCYGDISLAVKVLADCYSHGPNAHVGSCSSQVVTLVITLSLGSSDTSSLCLSHNVSTVPITTSLVALSDAQYAQFVASGSAPAANNIFLDTDYVNMVAQVQSVVNTSKVSVVSAWREYCALVCSGNNSISNTDLVKNGVVTTIVDHSENHTQYSVVRFINNDVPVNTQYYTVLHAVIEIEYTIAGGQRRSTLVQASVSQQQAQAQVASIMLQRGRIDAKTGNGIPPQSVEISLVLVGDLRPILANSSCVTEWKQMVSAGLASKLALLLGQAASRFEINVAVVEAAGASITINISPLNGQVDTVLTSQIQDLVANSASLFTIRVSACQQQTLATLSPDVFFMRSSNGSQVSSSTTAVASRSKVKKIVVLGASIGGAVCLLAFVMASFRFCQKKKEQVVEETRHGSGGINYSSVHIEAETAAVNKEGESPPVSGAAFREIV